MTADTSMLLAEHRTPDGTRPLVIGHPRACLSAMVLETGMRPVTCFTTTWAAVCSTEPHPTCLRVINPGEHYLQHTETNAAGRLLEGRETAYCAPCAIRDGHWWDIREATP